MNNIKEVFIGVQARSNSTRLPGKIYKNICGARVLDLVLEQAKSSAYHLSRTQTAAPVVCRVGILHPENDQELINAFKSSGNLMVGGSEEDVLSRYVMAQKFFNSDYIVRITSDCPLIPDFVITKHINVAMKNGGYDYVSNVDTCRTSPDGHDCEVLSARMLRWVDENARDPLDREHVTTLIRRSMPAGFRYAAIMNTFNTKSMKISLDTEEDLNHIRAYVEETKHCFDEAERIYGRRNVYRL